MRTCESTSPEDTKVGEEEGEEVSRSWTSDSPAAHSADAGEAAVPLLPLKVHGGTEIHFQCMEGPLTEMGDA